MLRRLPPSLHPTKPIAQSKRGSSHPNKDITGCLQKGYEPDEFSITGEDGKVWGLRSSAIKLGGHLGHKVTVGGLITHQSKAGETETVPGKKEAGDLCVTSLNVVSETYGKCATT
jgi:hypothetical protein